MTASGHRRSDKKAPDVTGGLSRCSRAALFGRGLRSEPENLVEIFQMKHAAVSIHDMHPPSGLEQSSSLRHGNNAASVERSRAFLTVFCAVYYKR